MYTGFIVVLLFFYLELCYSQCLIDCMTDTRTFQCHITATSTELDDNWIESCHDTYSEIQFLKIFITNYPYTTLPINSPANLPINNIMIYFDQPQSLTLNSNISNSNISSLTLSGDNPFTNGVKEFLSHFSNLVSLYILNNTQLHYLEDGSFVSLTRLQLLTVERVGIEIIGDNLFDGLSELKRLEWTNSFTYMLSSSAFFHLTSLQYLNLRNNIIYNIPESLFKRNLPNLQAISLVGNQLTTVPYQAFEQCSNLSLLKLEYNPLICKCDLYWMHYAEDLGYIKNITLSCGNNGTCNNTIFGCNSTTVVSNALNRDEIVRNCNDTDMYECLSPSQPCQHTCTNSPTSFNCSCDNGFYLEPDGFSCNSCPADYSYCSVSSCCIPSLYSCPLNLTDTLQLEMGVTVLQVSPLQEVVNRSILLSSADDQISLNLSLSVSCHVLVLSCEVYWLECFKVVMNFTLSESFPLQFSLPSADRDSPLHYLLLRVEGTEDKLVQLYERLLVVIQSSDPPTLYTRSLVRASTVSSSHVLIGAAVSSLEASMCADECPYLSVSLFSVGLIEVNISSWEGVSIQVVSCVSLPSQYWMSYNSYLFSIEWKNVSSQLNGRYELRVNGSGFVAVTEFSIDYPAADNACEGRLEMGVYWEWRINGTTASIPCSDMFGPHNDRDVDVNPVQMMERTCQSNLEWSDITNECTLSGSITKILSFSAIVNPSQLKFSLIYFPTENYTYLCLNYTISLLMGLEVPILYSQQNDNILSIWFNATDVNIDIINSFLFTELSANLSTCLTDYSLHFITQSTVCDCTTSLDGYPQELQHTVLCTVPACDCMESSCFCNIGLYGDGNNCSVDTDGDGLPDNLVICGDSLCVDTCPYQSRCTSEVSEECESVCPLETDSLFNIAWPCTAGGANREVLCPTGENRAYRKCYTDSIWDDPDTSSCVSDAYADILLNNTDQLTRLLAVLETVPPMVFGDLIIALDILEENSRNLDTNTVQHGQTVLDLASRVISNLVSDSNKNLLPALQNKRPVVESLLNSVDKFVENLAIRNCSTTSLQNDRVSFSILSIGDPTLTTSVSADNIKIGENNQSPSVDVLPNEEVSCVSFVVIENLASLVTDTSSLKFGSLGLDSSVFEEIVISSTLISLHLYNDNQVISKKGGDPLVTLHFPIDTSIIDLDNYRVEVAVGFLDTETGDPIWQGGGIGLVSGSLASTFSVEISHLTAYAAILGINSISPTSTVFPIITYIGSTIAIICLVLSLIVYVFFGYRLLKKIYHFILFNLTLSLLLCYVVFMLGVELAYANFLQFIPCKIISYLFTYLLLVTFLWMLMETIVIFMMAMWPYYRINVKYIILFFCISWLGPLLYSLVTLSWFHAYSISPPFDQTVAVTSPVEPLSGVCWIDTDISTNISILFLAIPAVIITVSIFCIIVVVCVLLKFVRRDEPEIPRSTRASIRLLTIISILYPLIFLGWLFGLLAISIKLNVLFWFFALFASAQGIVFLLVILVRVSIYLSMVKLFSRAMKLFRPEAQRPVFTQPTLARLLDDDVLRRSTLELAKQQGLISPIVEIDELMVFLEEKPWQSKSNLGTMGEGDLEYLRNQLAPDTEPEKPGLPPIFEITQLMTFLEERSLEERTKNTVVTDLSVLDSSIFLTDVEAIKDTHSRDIIYQGKDPFAYTEIASKSDAKIHTELPKVKYTDQEKLIKPNPEAESNGDTSPRYQAEHENTSYDIPQLLEIEVGLLELQEVMAQVDTPATRIAPKHVIEIQPDEFPTLKSVRENQRPMQKAVVPSPTVEDNTNFVIQNKEENLAFDNITSLSSFMDSRISTTQLPKTEIVKFTPPPQEDPIESLDFLIDQIGDLLADFDTLSPFTKT